MKILKSTVLLVLLGTVSSPGLAQNLPYDPTKASCEEIIAHTDDNTATKSRAATLYAHGMHMGKRCIDVDYVRAFELWAEIGDRNTIRSVLNDLMQRANGGNAAAASHLRKLEAAGYIEETAESRSR